MKLAIYHGADRPIAIEQVADPEPAANEVLVRIGYCGICGSDLSMTSGSAFDYPAGCPLGHEYAGEVVERGSAVTGLKVGDIVSCIPNGFCGECRACREGRLLACTNGRPLLGGMGEYMAVPEQAAVRVVGGLSLIDATLVEPIACGRYALRFAGFRLGDHVMVLGAGAMALAVIHWARMLGAGRIGVLARSERGRETAMRFGADYYVSEQADGPDGAARLLARDDADLPGIVAECVGKPGMIAKASEHVRAGGKVIAMGMCGQTEPLVPILQTYKQISLFFPLGYAVEDFEETIRSFDRAGVDPAVMVSRIVGLDALPATMEAMRRNGSAGKVLVDPFG